MRLRSSDVHAGVDQRQFDVAQGVGAGQQVEGLKDETDFAIADFGQLVVIQFADVGAVQFVSARSAGVQAAEQVHQGGFAGTGRPHDGHVFAALDLQGNIAQGVDGLRAHLIEPGDVLEANQAHGASSWSIDFHFLVRRRPGR